MGRTERRRRRTRTAAAAITSCCCVKTLEGYQNLIKLVSSGFLEGFYYKPRIDYDLLANTAEGLIALSACLRGAVTESVVEERYDQARENAYRLRDIFGKGNFFLEIQDQGLEIEKAVNPQLVRLSKETGIPLVATNDCHYLKHSDAHAQEVLLCIQTGKTMSDAHRMKFATDQFYFKTAEEMAQVFGELPEALSRTVDIAARCNVKIETHRRILSRNLRFPPGIRPAAISRRWSAKVCLSRSVAGSACAKPACCAISSGRIRTAPDLRNRDDPEDALLRATS